MPNEFNTEPTIQTVLDRMDAGFAEMQRHFDAINASLDRIIKRLDSIIHKLEKVSKTQ